MEYKLKYCPAEDPNYLEIHIDKKFLIEDSSLFTYKGHPKFVVDILGIVEGIKNVQVYKKYILLVKYSSYHWKKIKVISIVDILKMHFDPENSAKEVQSFTKNKKGIGGWLN